LAGGDETDLLAVLLRRDTQAEAARLLTDRGLVEMADREPRARQLRLRQREQKVRLVLLPIDAAPEAVAPRLLVEINLRVRARGARLGGKSHPTLDQRGELQVAVAVHAGDGRASRRVLAHEIGDDVVLELALEVDDVVGDADGGRDPARVVEIVERAAAAERD